MSAKDVTDEELCELKEKYQPLVEEAEQLRAKAGEASRRAVEQS